MMNNNEHSDKKVNYQVIENPKETPLTLYCFPGCFQGGWVEGITIEFLDYGWCGSFSYGDVSPNGVSGIYTYPGNIKLLVVSKGQGFIVNPNEPRNTIELNEQPILDVIYNKKNNLLVIYDFIRFTAFGENGKQWKTEALSYDGLKIKFVTEDYIVGDAWSAPLNEWVEFKLNIDTGKYEGGAR